MSNITIQLGQTVYGGTRNVTTGVLTIDRAIVDMGTLEWITGSIANGNRRFQAALPGIKVTGAIGNVANAICSQYSVESHEDQYYNGGIGVAVHQTDQKIMIYDTAYLSTSAENFKTAMNGVQLCYELATPTTIQLTANQLQMLKGYNRLSADTGDITVKAYTGAAWGGDTV